jgi:transposase InsO family protein
MCSRISLLVVAVELGSAAVFGDAAHVLEVGQQQVGHAQVEVALHGEAAVLGLATGHPHVERRRHPRAALEILAWQGFFDPVGVVGLKSTAHADVEWTGMPAAPVETRARLLADRGSGSLAAAFEDYLRALEIRHIYCAPHHPQTNGKLERFHETLKARLNLLV